ncbi:MAG: hypothetical protein QHH02_02590 [Syntrophomonadaceae bacterium]|nr:hypothetical protein [Syntrophomonadaceae bacterium]
MLGIAVPVAVRLIPYASGLILAGGCLFCLVLCYLAWTAISTIFRGYFSSRASILIALSGLLMLSSDLGMAVAGLAPGFAGQFVPGLKNLIWATYIPAWTLVVVVIAETRLLSGQA